jgi:hypothetical protein
MDALGGLAGDARATGLPQECLVHERGLRPGRGQCPVRRSLSRTDLSGQQHDQWPTRPRLAKRRKRRHIETFFSDQKSRGFQVDRSHLSDPERAGRLMPAPSACWARVFAASLAYLWVSHLGTVAQDDDWLPVIHRRHGCGFSLFQLSLRLLDYFLYHDQPIPSSFAIEPETVRL